MALIEEGKAGECPGHLATMRETDFELVQIMLEIFFPSPLTHPTRKWDRPIINRFGMHNVMRPSRLNIARTEEYIFDYMLRRREKPARCLSASDPVLVSVNHKLCKPGGSFEQSNSPPARLFYGITYHRTGSGLIWFG